MENIIVMAGNVGAGKSTFAKVISEKLGFEVHHERVENNPFLEEFYYDQKEWSYHLQSYFLVHRYISLKNAEEENKNIVFDRSIYEDYEIFSKNLYATGKMTKREFFAYEEMYNSMCKYLQHPDLLVYIDSDVDTIITRIRRRGREMELQTPISYWQRLDNLYKSWIRKYNYSRIYKIDAREIDIVMKPDQIPSIINDIKHLLNTD
ncbi:MAG: deoxynucleoside kinase [Asgard group archaeon]|nr:deoxynucleoside kinase [Asgard group archaeon]